MNQVLKAGARVDSLTLSLGELADRARAVLREESEAAAMLASTRRMQVAPPGGRGYRRRGPCFSCGEIGHVARDCPRAERPGRNQQQPAPGCGGQPASARGRRWVMWKWAGDRPPGELGGAVDEYPVPEEARAEYEAELQRTGSETAGYVNTTRESWVRLWARYR